MTRDHLISVSEIAQRLGNCTEALCLKLLPNGHREGHDWCVGSVAGEPGRSMRVRLDGAKAGVWCDWAGRPEDRGDGLDLVAMVLFRGNKTQAIRWARGFLALDSIDPDSLPTQRRAIEEKKRQAKAEAARRQERAMHIFLAADEKIMGTETERYLARRAIDLHQLGRVPRVIRHHRGLVHPEPGEIAPAMVAAITNAEGKTVSVHRTFLERQADGSADKLSGVKDAKLSLGDYAGGFIRLWRGKTRKPLREAVAGEWIVLGEGIEDVLTIVLARPDLRAIAGISLGNYVNIVLPPAIEGVYLLQQNDKQPEAIAAFGRAVQHFIAQGKRVRLARPGPGVKDVNELAQRERKEERSA